MEPGEIIREEREKRGWSQAQLAGRVGISQVAIAKIEAGETKQSKHLWRIAQVLEIDPDDLFGRRSDRSGITSVTGPLRPIPLPTVASAPRDFPVYASAEGGPGEIIRSVDPIDRRPRPQPLLHADDAYGIYVMGDSMVPEYRPGDVALVNPRLPVVGDEVYIFYAEREGEARATIKHLRRATPDKWLVTQHNPPNGKPKDFTLSRKEWQWAHRVVGKYARG